MVMIVILYNADVIRLVNNAFAYTFKHASISTTSGSEIEINKYVGQVSTIMKVLTSKVWRFNIIFR